MFIPLHDANALKRIRLQFVTLALIAINVVVYFGVNIALPAEATQAVITSFGYIPAVIHDHRELSPDLVFLPEGFSFVTYAFLHGDILHIGTNMLFLWVFGDNIEDAMGHVRFLVFFVFCAAAGALAHGLMDTRSVAPLIGASGAVAGIIGAYLVLHPRVKVWVLALGRIPLRLPAWIPLLAWIAFQIFMLVTMPEDMVSWAAHVGGFAAGAVLVIILKRSDVPLFDRTLKTPDAVIHEGTLHTTSAPPPLPDRGPRQWGR